jgi:biopolymer transport protein TolR
MPKVVAAGSSGHGGAGRRRRPRVTTALSEINVVPLVDVMLVLLIIFMVAAPMMQQGINVNLPQSRRAPAMPQSNEAIYVTVPVAFAKNGVVQLGNETIRLGVLTERIRQMVSTRDDKQVFLRSDGAVTMQQVMTVKKVAIVAQAPSR